jgi:fructose-1,6-bisphosphatase/sedoheptulose 1,7-bisphosphatase-like protein
MLLGHPLTCRAAICRQLADGDSTAATKVAIRAGGVDVAATAAAAAEGIEAATPAVRQAGLSEAVGRATRVVTHPTD